MEITVIFLLILITFYRRSTENTKAEYVCLLKHVAKFKDVISWWSRKMQQRDVMKC